MREERKKERKKVNVYAKEGKSVCKKTNCCARCYGNQKQQ